jgi:hypothetical protein
MEPAPDPEASPAAEGYGDDDFAKDFPRLAPLLAVHRKIVEAQLRPLKQQKHFTRLLELAEATLGRDIEPSMVLAQLYFEAVRVFTQPLRTPDTLAEADKHETACWAEDPAHTLEFSRRCAALLLRRFNSGTLLELRPEEEAWAMYSMTTATEEGLKLPRDALPLLLSTVMLLHMTCGQAFKFWPQTLAGAQTKLLTAAARMLVQTDPAVATFPVERPAHGSIALHCSAETLVTPLAVTHLPRSALTADEWTVIDRRFLVLKEQLHCGVMSDRQASIDQATALNMRKTAVREAEDAAKNGGLRRCALPSCAVEEPHVSAFKRCSRCNTAKYCCAAHQRDDWPRHKHADCTPKAPADEAAE